MPTLRLLSVFAHAHVTLFLAVWMGSAMPAVTQDAPAAVRPLSQERIQTAAHRVDAVLAEAEAAGVRVGVAVLDFSTGAAWLSRRGRETFIPASNQKILTSLAALKALGVSHKFETGFEYRDGWVVVHPGGDPNWITGTEHDPQRMFERVVNWLRSLGVRTLQGVRCLDGVYGGEADVRPAGWPSDQLDRTYCSPGGGLLLEAGCFVAEITHGGAGAKHATVRMVAPPGDYRVTGDGVRMTTDRKKGSVYGVQQKGDSFRPFGKFWTKANPVTVRASIDRPTAAFERALRASIRGAGIQLRDTSEAVEPVDLSSGVGDHPRFSIRTPLSAALSDVLANSSNVHAEQVLRAVGVGTANDGTIEGGARAVRATLTSWFGSELLPSGWKLVDGSGLSRGNEVTPRFLIEAMSIGLNDAVGDEFLGALASGGAASGTLRRRFTERPMRGRVRAKTGTIRAVSALSGVVRDREDRLQVFSILMNVRQGKRVRASKMRAMQDRIATAIAGYAQ